MYTAPPRTPLQNGPIGERTSLRLSDHSRQAGLHKPIGTEKVVCRSDGRHRSKMEKNSTKGVLFY